MTSNKTSDKYLQVNSCGMQWLADSDFHTSRPKGRVDYHILYMIQGNCYAEKSGKAVVLKEGELILYLPGESQKYSFLAAEKTLSGYIHFTGVGCEQILANCGLLNHQICNVGVSKKLQEIIKKMSDEYLMSQPFSDEICVAYLMEFLALVGRRMANGDKDKSIYLSNKTRIVRVCREILLEYDAPHPLQYYADKCNLSVGYFSHIFKETMGMSPTEYINMIRINKAKEYLENTDYSISQIAEYVGFSSQNYFCRIFKKYVGVSPGKYISEL